MALRSASTFGRPAKLREAAACGRRDIWTLRGAGAAGAAGRPPDQWPFESGITTPTLQKDMEPGEQRGKDKKLSFVRRSYRGSGEYQHLCLGEALESVSTFFLFAPLPLGVSKAIYSKDLSVSLADFNSKMIFSGAGPVVQRLSAHVLLRAARGSPVWIPGVDMAPLVKLCCGLHITEM
nr:uncharacterized protein LOC106824774 [Equus asinus]